ncbi:T9SS type A sorting domain-containing protein [Candidatus Latescibacterota bacterium]
MKPVLSNILTVFFFFFCTAIAQADNARIIENYGKIPLAFTANQDQLDSQIQLFLSNITANNRDGLPLSFEWDRVKSTIIEAPEYIFIDTNLATAGYQGGNSIENPGPDEFIGFAVYLKEKQGVNGFTLDITWDAMKAVFRNNKSGISITDDDITLNGNSLIMAEEDNILELNGAQTISAGEINEAGRYQISYAKAGRDEVEVSEGLIYLAIFKTTSELSIDEEFSITFNLEVVDETKEITELGNAVFTIYPGQTEYLPPTDISVSDVPEDHGHSLELRWSLSPDDASITQYNIYRSLNPELTEPLSIETFTSIDELVEKEQNYTIFIGSVPAGQNTFVDSYVPLNGVTYYYWLQAVGSGGASQKVAASIITRIVEKPTMFELHPAYPNPFNPTTSIQYEVNVESQVKLVIYDILGREIIVLQDGLLSAGFHTVVWNGRNKEGIMTGSGVYIYKVMAGKNTAQGKVMFIR